MRDVENGVVFYPLAYVSDMSIWQYKLKINILHFFSLFAGSTEFESFFSLNFFSVIFQPTFCPLHITGRHDIVGFVTFTWPAIVSHIFLSILITILVNIEAR